MERLRFDPRTDWDAKAEELGFSWRHTDGKPYWDETAAYAFSLAEIEDGIEAPTEELHGLCLELVNEAVQSERLMEQLDIPEAMRDYVADSWKRGDPSLYGRFDFAYDGTGPAKLYEYNADTPTSIYETAVFQWLWLEDQIKAGALPADADQFNSLHEKLVDRFRAIFPNGGFVHFASDADFVEDRQTVRFLEDLAQQAGLEPQFVAIDQIGLNADGRFVDHENWIIQAMFKLYPWEQMLRDCRAARKGQGGGGDQGEADVAHGEASCRLMSVDKTTVVRLGCLPASQSRMKCGTKREVFLVMRPVSSRRLIPAGSVPTTHDPTITWLPSNRGGSHSAWRM